MSWARVSFFKLGRIMRDKILPIIYDRRDLWCLVVSIVSSDFRRPTLQRRRRGWTPLLSNRNTSTATVQRHRRQHWTHKNPLFIRRIRWRKDYEKSHTHIHVKALGFIVVFQYILYIKKQIARRNPMPATSIHDSSPFFPAQFLKKQKR